MPSLLILVNTQGNPDDPSARALETCRRHNEGLVRANVNISVVRVEPSHLLNPRVTAAFEAHGITSLPVLNPGGGGKKAEGVESITELLEQITAGFPPPKPVTRTNILDSAIREVTESNLDQRGHNLPPTRRMRPETEDPVDPTNLMSDAARDRKKRMDDMKRMVKPKDNDDQDEVISKPPPSDERPRQAAASGRRKRFEPKPPLGDD